MNVQEQEGWWEGRLNTVIGMFPSNFVEIMEGEEPEKQSNVFLVFCLECILRNLFFSLVYLVEMSE